jgi:2-dehydropantoate 2-reductase
MPDSLLITGSGAMACLFAARIAATGYPVIMMGTWLPALDALRSRGVCISDKQGERCYPVTVVSNPEECPPVDLALVLVKSWQTSRVAGSLKGVLSPGGTVLTLQNGLGNYEILMDAVGTDRVAVGVTVQGATSLEPGKVKPNGTAKINIGRQPGVDRLVKILETAGFEIGLQDDVRLLIWRKLAINAAINPLTAILGVANGELIRRPTARQMLSCLVKEVCLTAASIGIELDPQRTLNTVETVSRNTAANYSSMLQDVRRGGPTEVDAINGAVVRTAAAAGIDTPYNEAMVGLVKSLLE